MTRPSDPITCSYDDVVDELFIQFTTNEVHDDKVAKIKGIEFACEVDDEDNVVSLAITGLLEYLKANSD